MNEYPDYVMREFKLVDTRVSHELDYIKLLIALPVLALHVVSCQVVKQNARTPTHMLQL